MFEARDYEDYGEFDRRRPNRQDNSSRNSRSSRKSSSAKRSSSSSRKRSSGASVGGIHNRKNKHWNW